MEVVSVALFDGTAVFDAVAACPPWPPAPQPPGLPANAQGNSTVGATGDRRSPSLLGGSLRAATGSHLFQCALAARKPIAPRPRCASILLGSTTEAPGGAAGGGAVVRSGKSRLTRVVDCTNRTTIPIARSPLGPLRRASSSSSIWGSDWMTRGTSGHTIPVLARDHPTRL